MLARLAVGITTCTVGAFFFNIQIKSKNNHIIGQSDYTGSSLPINRVVFRSDGALNHKWFLNWMGPLRGLSLSEINLEKLQNNLIQEDQILTAQVK